MHVILYRPDSETVIVSQNSNEYCDYLLAEYTGVFFGSRKECLEFLETIESVNNN